MSSKESLMILNKTKANILLQKIFITHYKYCYKGQKYCKLTWKRNKTKHGMKKDHSKR